MAEIKQYVNLDVDSSQPNFGRVVKVKAGLEKKQADMVFLYLKSDAENKDVSKLKRSNQGGINVAGSIKSSMIAESDGTLEFDLVLSNYGGDKFSTEVTTDSKGKKDLKSISDTYVVWKKLYYQVSQMKASYSFPFDKVKTEYESHLMNWKKLQKSLCLIKKTLKPMN